VDYIADLRSCSSRNATRCGKPNGESLERRSTAHLKYITRRTANVKRSQSKQEAYMAGQLIQKGEDSWLLRIYRGHDPLTKKRIYKAVKFEGDQEQARVELDRLVQAQAEGSNLKPSDMTVNQHFDQWFANVAENRYSYKTVENYRGIITFDVRPLIGHVQLSDLQPRHIQSVFVAMAAHGVC
jgi:hypothetical protein